MAGDIFPAISKGDIIFSTTTTVRGFFPHVIGGSFLQAPPQEIYSTTTTTCMNAISHYLYVQLKGKICGISVLMHKKKKKKKRKRKKERIRKLKYKKKNICVMDNNMCMLYPYILLNPCFS